MVKYQVHYIDEVQGEEDSFLVFESWIEARQYIENAIMEYAWSDDKDLSEEMNYTITEIFE